MVSGDVGSGTTGVREDLVRTGRFLILVFIAARRAVFLRVVVFFRAAAGLALRRTAFFLAG